MRAAIHLMDSGYNVFRALSPSCPFDLYAFKGDRSLRVEVTTGHNYTRSTRPEIGAFFPTQKIAQLRNNEFDLLLVVFEDRIEEMTDDASVQSYRDKAGMPPLRGKRHGKRLAR